MENIEIMEQYVGASGQVQSKVDTIVSGKPWWLICISGCLLMILGLLVGSYFLFRFLAGPVSVELSELPVNYPKELPLLKINEAVSIKHIEGKGRGKIVRILTSPFELTIKSVSSTAAVDFKKNMDEFTDSVTENDSVIVKWSNLKSTKAEILKYYSDLFKKNEMKESFVKDDMSASEYVSASGKNAAIQILINDNMAGEGGLDLTVIVDYSAK